VIDDIPIKNNALTLNDMEIDVVVMIECVLNTINDAHTSMFT